MNVRWRLGIVAAEMVVLWATTHFHGSHEFWVTPWFIAMVGVIVNGLIVEPFFPKPGDVVTNSIAFVSVAATAGSTVAQPAWRVGAVIAWACLALALFALYAGSGRRTGRIAAVADCAAQLCRIGSARIAYSAMFLLSALDAHPGLDVRFWTLVSGWCAILLISALNWQRIWKAASGRAEFCFVEGMIGPSTLLVSGPFVPATGSAVILKTPHRIISGVITQRLRRKGDSWGAIHISSGDDCEAAVGAETLDISAVRGGTHDAEHLIGVADAGSTDRKISFVALRQLEVGSLVVVQQSGDPVLYQLSAAAIETVEVRGGSHLAVRATGIQVGRYRPGHRVSDFPWVAAPGSRVLAATSLDAVQPEATPDGAFLVGHISGTKIPVLMDVQKAREGHIVVLGMTKMGKSTLAERLAKQLGRDACVVVLDQTGEWVGKKGFPRCDKSWTGKTPGVTVFEPSVGEVPPDRALACLNGLVKLGREEYATGVPFPRVAIIDEAHQFVPEPAGMGFNAPGRESAIAIGMLLMQIRKYGICVIMVTQRTAVVSKSALSQCENVIAFRSVDKTGLDYLEGILGEGACDVLPKLGHAHALAYGPALSCERPVVVKASNGS